MSYPETLSKLTNYPKALSHAGSGGGGLLSGRGDAGAVLEVNATPEEAANAVAVDYVSSSTGGHERAFITSVFYSEGSHGMQTVYFSRNSSVTSLLIYDGTKYVVYNPDPPQG